MMTITLNLSPSGEYTIQATRDGRTVKTITTMDGDHAVRLADKLADRLGAVAVLYQPAEAA